MERSARASRLIVFLFPIVLGCGEAVEKPPSLAEEFQKAQSISNPATRAQALVGVAAKQLEAKDYPGAEASIYAAKKACEEIQSARRRTTWLTEIAILLAGDHQVREARRLLGQAEQGVDQIENPSEKADVMIKLAEAYGVHLQQSDLAMRNLQQAQETVASIEDSTFQVTTLVRLIQAAHRLELSSLTERLLKEAAGIARGLTDARQRCGALTAVAVGAHEVQQTAQAASLFDDALDSSQTIEKLDSRTFALIELAQAKQTVGQQDAAWELYNQAKTLARQVQDGGNGRLLQQKLKQLRQSL